MLKQEALSQSMQRLQSQPTLFAPKLNRLSLQALATQTGVFEKNIHINVWRNHAFEPIASLMVPYAAFGEYGIKFNYSDYDDTLTFHGWFEADLELLWIDNSRYQSNISADSLSNWLISRIEFLRSKTLAPILLATWFETEKQVQRLQTVIDAVPATYYCDLNALAQANKLKLLNRRTAAMAGTPISSSIQPLLARELACHWIPAAVVPGIKAIVLDLDNTLHRGVLGEDGIEGVKLTPQHRDLQIYLKNLQQRGVFLALVSRNEGADVEALFKKRTDYPLRWEDFSTTQISWNEKPQSIATVAQTLRIAENAVLFVDDNPGELAAVAAQLSQVHCVYATPDASLTQHAIHYYPSLWRWKVEADDTLRIRDLKAIAKREAMLVETMSREDYFRSLEISLCIRIDPLDQLSRLSDLCGKTNQFNLALRRFNQADLMLRLQRQDACVASVQLSDRLSDSGVIAVIVAERVENTLVIEELCISCRALGRQLEHTLVFATLRQMPLFSGCRKIAFRVERGARNQPGLQWLAQVLNLPSQPQPGLHDLQAGSVLQFSLTQGISIVRG